jgi:hypothetical protein
VTEVDGYVAQTLAEQIVELVRTRDGGHCLQVPHLPEAVADAACELVSSTLEEPDLATLVAVSPTKPWHARPTKIVELRNEVPARGGRLVVFVPAGRLVAAEDSFGASTFEIFDTADLGAAVVRRLETNLGAVSDEIAELAGEVAGVVRGDARFDVDDEQVSDYLSRLARDPDPQEVGRALVAFGLLPDRSFAERDPDERESRLVRNLQQMQALTTAGPPPERVRQLPLDQDLPDAQDIARTLLDVLDDGTLDRRELALRLDEPGRGEVVDLESWQLDAMAVRPTEFRVLQLAGDFTGDLEPLVTKPNASIGVRSRCRPAPAAVTGLKEMTLELLRVGENLDDLAETGVEAVRRRSSLPRAHDSQWRLRVATQDLDAGLYCFRIRAFDEDNAKLAEAKSDPFRIGDVDPLEIRVDQVPSVAAALVGAARQTENPRALGLPKLALDESKKSEAQRKLRSLAVRFEGAPAFWEFRSSRLLAQIEEYTLDDPESLGRYSLSIGSTDVEEVVPEGHAAQRFIEARAEMFSQIRRNQLEIEGGENVGASIALADLTQLAVAAATYLETWLDALRAAGTGPELRTLLSVDQVTVDDRHGPVGRLVGPTHPLRLAWLVRYEQTLAEWVAEEADEREAEELESLVKSVQPANLPHVVPGERGPLRFLESIDLYWGLWAPPNSLAANLLSARVRTWLGVEDMTTATVSVDDVVLRIRRYLATHPYVDLLVLNFVQPASAQVVLDALLRLQREAAGAQLRYVIRLFATELSRSELGSALDAFMVDPDSARAARRDEADAFLASAEDPLTPKLTYSKHDVSELVTSPEDFPAHLTFFLDWFDLEIVPAPPAAERRSFFGAGLIVDPVILYREGSATLSPQWDEYVVTAGEEGDPLIAAYGGCEEATARLLGTGEAGLVPAVRLDFDRVRRSILDAVHRTSDWVVVIDPVFTDDYLDTPPAPGEPQRYLIDYVGHGALETTRRIIVSTRSRAELANLLRPISERYALPISDDRIEVLLDALQALGAGLPLKLLNNRTQALEAFSLALASVYLADQGILRYALAVPLDLHQDLFREGLERRTDPVADLRRTDLAAIQVDVDARRFGVHLIEVKARGGLAERTPPELVETISAQLENSRSVLRSRLFGAELRERPRSLAASLQVRRLTRLMSHYLGRSIRYDLLERTRVPELRRLLTNLDHGYSIAFAKHALIFDMEGESQAPEQIDDVRVMRVGRTEILDLLARTQTPLKTRAVEGGEDEMLHSVFGRERQPEPEEIASVAEEEPGQVHEPVGEVEVAQRDRVAAPPSEGDSDEGPSLDDVLLIGSAQTSPQFGIVGRVAGSGKAVAADFDGTNVVSIFGAQGSGKSYTVGTLLEAALLPDPELNRLPEPLGGIVFHYSTDQTYTPEYAAMAEANNDPTAVEALRRDYGTDPQSLPDVRILTTEPLVEERKLEFPGLDVAPLLLAPTELGLNEWKLLMGLEGGEQMYSRSMNVIFRKLRGRLSLDSLREEVEESALSQAQKNLAESRIQFAESFVRDGAGIADQLRQGGLVIVDLRDETVADDEALALFMVLLRLFAQVTEVSGKAFNKVIVFDEAHKYMNNPRLTNAIVETVREMRHRGTNVVIASQNPPSVPKEVIELSQIVVAHRFTSPQWLDHVRRVNAAFGEGALRPSQLAGLEPGEAFVWSGGGAEEFRRPQRIQIRPRSSRHGGGTRRATRNG